MIFADSLSGMVMEFQEEQGDFLCRWAAKLPVTDLTAHKN